MAERALVMSISSKQTDSKKRRKRTIITKNVLERLEKMFAEDQWPSRQRKEILSAEINKSENFVNNWFQNRRARMKRTSLTCKNILNGFDREPIDHQETNIKFHEIKFNSEIDSSEKDQNEPVVNTPTSISPPLQSRTQRDGDQKKESPKNREIRKAST